MNILVATISTFSRSKELRNYKIMIPDCDVEEISAYHTNESIIKCLSQLHTVKSTGGISKILALVTNKTLSDQNKEYDNKTAFEYYKSIVDTCCPNAEIVTVKLEDNNAQTIDTSEILAQICTNINRNDVVYIDGAGGQRTISNLIQLLTKMLKYIGIENPYNLYANIQNNQPFINDTSDFDRMTDLADAFNEFMTTGKSDQLNRCMTNQNSEEAYKKLLSVMGEFSDKIRLGNVEALDKIIVSLKKSIDECKNLESSKDIETVIIKQFLPAIEDKLIGGSKDVDFIKIISWCLDNVLIQQALTLFVEKMPKVLFDKKTITFRGDIIEEKAQYNLLSEKNKILPADWESYVFYTELIGKTSPLYTSTPSIISDSAENILRNCLKNGETTSDDDVNKTIEVIKSFDNLQLYSNNKSNKAVIIRNLIKERGFTSHSKLINAICNETKLLSSLLDSKTTSQNTSTNSVQKESSEVEETDTTLQKKFNALSKWDRQDHKRFNIFVPSDILLKAMYGYVYIKAIRNQTNHASSDELLTNNQKEILKQYGYVFETGTLKEIRQNISNALDAFQNCFVQETKEEDKPKTYTTDLHVGDICKATCIKNKIVRIESYDYDIQLIVPKPYSSTDYIDQTIDVKIKQISPAQKITQTEIIIN